MKTDATEFCPQRYRMLLGELIANGYSFGSFHAVRANHRDVIIRHDVDFSLEKAVKICEIDADAGCKATVFVLLATEFYNIFTRNGRQCLREILDQGHEIGLHFDQSVYDQQTVDLENAARHECEVLEGELGRPITVTAFHRPAQTPYVLGRPGLFADRLHAYAPEFFVDIGYVSDGAGFWSHGHPLNHPAINQGTALQILTHPYLWIGESGRTAFERIEAFRQEREAFLISEMRRNLRYYP